MTAETQLKIKNEEFKIAEGEASLIKGRFGGIVDIKMEVRQHPSSTVKRTTKFNKHLKTQHP
ncbi:hypothetical protein [Alistipes montrealensis]|uniref:hypothetical protein n=1 Tax=Alistipes montrealensis TaxID=2834113 RepID=UPI001BCDF6B0|nr:hypothetical protein [Alistipes montrealensis]